MSSTHSDVSGVTSEGAVWLASAGTYPRSTLSLWAERPTAPLVLPCGTAFDVVNVPAVFGRRMLDRLWDDGPGSGPVAAYRGRILLFAALGTAQRLPSLLRWEEWGSAGAGEGAEDGGSGARRRHSIPPLLCHGRGDAVTVPALVSDDVEHGEVKGDPRPESRWVVAPDTTHPWLPGPEILLWAAVRAARSAVSGGVRISIFPPTDQDANVYDVSRRR
ncbi:hypothetical protein [Streptomyces sp. SID12501]|uniref:DNA primase/polymerase bifunctional N-terminal domain-containing protein n=1 Tax=Streptomyces sp. SID12501 TaxID=2706042 RepID=A0A6B3BMX0_9ACTN|nr:hypothetical protein [Streptomyces sp. SID12501]NEC85706.1 hypothetical protein [Streptomyces sp. SID12501]